ncbi:MAG: sulfatase-like hydrolase/transferase [Magnetococcus sp. MYC-9]
MPSPSRIRSLLLNRYTAFLTVVFLYIALSPIIELTRGIWHMEVPLLLYLYHCLNRLTRPSRWQPLVTALPLFTLYLGHDYYFLRFARVPQWAEFTQLSELLGVIDLGMGLLLGALILFPLLFWTAFLKRPPYRVRGLLATLLLLLPVIALFASPIFYHTAFINIFKRLSVEVIYYSTVINVEKNGRLTTSLYHEAKRRETLKSLVNYRDVQQLSLRLPAELTRHANGKNVHLIVLESFLDPTLFDKLPKSIKPVHPDYLKLVGKGQSLSVSPIFGGYTAQPEFEVLCGVPAFQEFDEVEFNIFTGSKTYCLPALLRELGYASLASNAYKPEFFNTILAYKSIDFDAVHFAKEYTPTLESYLSKGEGGEENKFFFDEDLFAQNLAYVRQQMEKKRPFFNYVLTVYGHFPFDLGPRAGPPLFESSELPEAVVKILNQHYYRTKALAGYIKQLIAMDPTSLIVLVSDHLPPLPGGIGEYDRLGYFQTATDRLLVNRLLVFREGKIEKQGKFAHFNIYRLILDFVTDHAYCRAMPCNFGYPVDREALRNDYRTLIGLASQ